MDAGRRNLLKAGAVTATLASGVTAAAPAAAGSPAAVGGGSHGFPAKEEFPGIQGTYLNSASVHPLSRGASQAMAKYAEGKLQGSVPVNSAAVQAKFAKLINATPAEICYVPSTSMGEYLVTASLGLPGAKGRIVTDALHFVGSLYLYEQLAQRGADVVTLRMRSDGSIDLKQFEQAITPETKLVAVSHVSFVNGFEHDMKAICDIAHSRGALVFADIIQSVGALPVDVKAWDVDFAAAGTYKWLMGDFGLAFLYVKSSLHSRLQRPWFGYLQTSNFFNPPTRLYPHDPAGEPAIQFTHRNDLGAIFNGSFPARAVEVAVDHSLDWLLSKDVARIHAYRQPMIDAVQKELRRRGFEPMTPEGSRTPIVSFAYKEPAKLAPRLKDAGVSITLSGNRFRISPSVFNDMNDVDRLLGALGAA
jgi:selenocysteine lyase/cysteine desulfurase